MKVIVPFLKDAYFQFALHSSFYGKVPPAYTTTLGDRNFERAGKQLMARIMSSMKLRSSDTVLEVGCGLGTAALPLSGYINARVGGSYEGFDLVKQSIEWCRRKYRRHKNFNFFHANLYEAHYNPEGLWKSNRYRFPYPDNTFDFVLLTSVFNFLMPNEVKHFLSEISRVMKTGATLFLKLFLMNDKVREIARENRGVFRFEDFDKCGEYTILQRKGREHIVGYEEKFIETLCEHFDLQIRKPFRYGNWSGRESYYSFQDVVLAVKI